MVLSPNRREFLQILAAGVAASSSTLAQSVAAVLQTPFIQDIRKNRATICWITSEPTDGVVEFWDDAQTLRTVKAAKRQITVDRVRFEAVLEDLAPASTYGYRVATGTARSAVSSFQTPGTASFEFLAFGDSGMGTPEQAAIAKRLLQHPASFVLHTGDLVYPAGTFERYESLYFAYYQDLMSKAPFFPCPGNHDYYEASCIPYRALHSVPGGTVRAEDQGRYYSFDWGNAHFVSLDSNDSLYEAAQGTGDMLRWLDADLAASRKFFRIVVVHHCPYASGVHNNEPECVLIREKIAPILQKHGVPLVLNGHEHSYQRSIPIGGTTYITTGGGGATLHPITPAANVEKAVSEHHYLSLAINGSRLKLRALRPDGTELDTWELAPPPVIKSVVDGASFGTTLAAGGLVSIFGQNLTDGEGPAPKGLVTLNGQPARVLLASPSQLNVVLADSPGEITLSVQAPNGVVTQKLTVEAIAPALFEGAIIRSDGICASQESPVRPGETLTVYATGIGSGLPLAVEWEGTTLPAQASALPGLSAVSVVSFQTPNDPFRAAKARLVVAGKRSNAVLIPGS